ncbi:MAG: phage tail protein [Acidimicrobiia bacterium]|nr:phage tail protein [Acidimicrobiia bacterium]
MAGRAQNADRYFMGSLFGLVVDGQEIARFTGVSGLSIECEVVEFPDTNGHILINKAPGPVTFGECTLKQGFSAETGFTDWVKTFVDGSGQRTSASVTVLDPASSAVLDTFTLSEAWPSKWSTGSLGADSNEVLVEELTVQYELLQRKPA